MFYRKEGKKSAVSLDFLYAEKCIWRITYDFQKYPSENPFYVYYIDVEI